MVKTRLAQWVRRRRERSLARQQTRQLPASRQARQASEAQRYKPEVLPEDVAAAAVDFITGPLLEAPYRVGKPLRDKLAGFRSARLGTQWRVLYRIDESKRVVVVQDIQHRSNAYRRR